MKVIVWSVNQANQAFFVHDEGDLQKAICSSLTCVVAPSPQNPRPGIHILLIKAHEIFQKKRIFTDFRLIFLEQNKTIMRNQELCSTAKHEQCSVEVISIRKSLVKDIYKMNPLLK